MASQVSIKVGTGVVNWDGKATDGDLVSTGDYLVKAQVSEAASVSVYSKVLTVVVVKQDILSAALIGPNPASQMLVIDLSRLPLGLDVDIQVWNLAGELIRDFAAVSGPGSRLLWDLRSGAGQALADGVYIVSLRSRASDPRLQDKRNFKLVVLRN